MGVEKEKKEREKEEHRKQEEKEEEEGGVLEADGRMYWGSRWQK